MDARRIHLYGGRFRVENGATRFVVGSHVSPGEVRRNLRPAADFPTRVRPETLARIGPLARDLFGFVKLSSFAGMKRIGGLNYRFPILKHKRAGRNSREDKTLLAA